MNLTTIRAAISAMFVKQPLVLSNVNARGNWFPLWSTGPDTFQTDVTINRDTVISNGAVYACMTLIASDIGKLNLRLMAQDAGGIWSETTSPTLSPVLRRPNHFQTRQQFIETWMASKLSTGNTYALKQRDARGVVVRLYVLDPQRVVPLVAENGDVFYQLNSDALSGLPLDIAAAPASEIIHDRMECLFHPLVGISPIFACGLAATQGLKIQTNSAKFFENMSRPSGILSAPGNISDDTAKRLKAHWEGNFAGNKIGKVAVLGDSLKYEAMTVNAVDAQLVEQLKMSDEKICSVFHVPGFMVGVGTMPSYDNVQALWQQYYSQCLQKLIESVEALLDDGLGLGVDGKYRTEFDLDDLLRMDSKTLAEVEGVKVQRGIASPNEARRKFNLKPAKGGDAPYLQQQQFSLEALAKRDATDDPFGAAKPPAAPAAPAAPPSDDSEKAALLIANAELRLAEKMRADTEALRMELVAIPVDQTDKALARLFRKSPEAMIHA